MEKLTGLLLLYLSGFGSAESYFAEPDKLFTERPDDEFLFELEDCLKDLRGHWARVSELLECSSGKDLDIELFGRKNFGGLEKYFDENVGTGKITLCDFGRRCYKLWLLFPWNICNDDPFVILCYADEPLDYGDEKQSMELYRRAFDYFKE